MSEHDLRVLVVDDQPAILRFLGAALGVNGCTTAAAGSAEEALTLLAQQSYDLVISDVKMPGLSGLDLLRAVKTRQPDTPVVLITGAPSVDSAVFGLRHGAFDYLAKPFTPQDVRALIERVREERSRSARYASAPAGLAEDLARRQFGFEVLFRISALAVEGTGPEPFFEMLLRDTARSLGGQAAMILLRDGDGRFSSRQDGDPALLRAMLAWLQGSFTDLLATGGRQVLTCTLDRSPAMAALMRGSSDASGVLCLARPAGAGAYLPDEKELFLGFAQSMALALDRVRGGDAVERHLLESIAAFVNAIEAKDRYLKGHSARVSLYAGELATAMKLPADEIMVACRGGMLHDLGKLGVLEPLLGKAASLTRQEYEVIMEHVEVGYRILKPLRFLARESLVVRHHHERYDGGGYPEGLCGEEIPRAARVVATVDAFDAMTSDRPYRKAMPFEVALEELERKAGTQFDPMTVAAFLTIPLGRLREISRYAFAPAEPAAAAGR